MLPDELLRSPIPDGIPQAFGALVVRPAQEFRAQPEVGRFTPQQQVQRDLKPKVGKHHHTEKNEEESSITVVRRRSVHKSRALSPTAVHRMGWQARKSKALDV